MAKSTRNQPKKKPGSRTRNKWTVMVYMAASKDDQTEDAAIRDLREMEKVGSSKDTAVVVQIDRDWPGHPERYFVEKGRSTQFRVDSSVINWWVQQSSDSLRSDEQRSNTGNPRVLEEFLTSVYKAYDSDYYLLVLWGHAFGLGFGRDHGDPLSVRELAKVLTGFRKKLNKKRRLILGTNACAMSYAEAVYELRHAAHYLIASEITMPFAGWPYARILQGLAGKNDVKAGEFIIDEFMDSFENKGVALSLIDLGKATSLSTHVGSLAVALRKEITTPGVSRQIADAFLDSAHGDVRPIIDLFDLCSNLKKVVGADHIVTKASKLMGALKSRGDLNKITQEPLEVRRDRLILKHESDPDFEGLHGLGIFAPAVTSGADLKRLELREKDYKALKLMRATKYLWARLVYHDLGSLLESTNEAMAQLVAGTGASSRDDREGVGQLLVAVTRSFDKLDRYAREGRECHRTRPGGREAGVESGHGRTNCGESRTVVTLSSTDD